MGNNGVARTRDGTPSGGSPRRLEQHTSSGAIKMRGFNFDKHQEPEINLVSRFPAEDPPRATVLFVLGVFLCFF